MRQIKFYDIWSRLYRPVWDDLDESLAGKGVYACGQYIFGYYEHIQLREGCFVYRTTGYNKLIYSMRSGR